MAKITPFSIRLVLFIISLVSNTDGLSLKMIPIDSPHLKLLPEYVTAQERHQFLVNISMSKVSNYPGLTPNGLKSGVRLDKESYYVTKLPLGTGPGRLSPFMVIDTASEETWIQCEGCSPCFESKEKNFDYKISTTFRKMSVDDPLCKPRLEYEGSCAFELFYSYAQRLRVSGILGRDVVYFQNSITGKSIAFTGYAFGCALKNDFKLYNNMRENIIVGIHGLALGPRSFLLQSHSYTKGRFSYCLAAGMGISNMYFGDEAQISGDSTREVRTIAMNKWIKYHVYLNAISVNGIRISFDPSIFELDPRGSKGFFVDSGAPYTMLAESAFKPIRDAVVNYFKEKFGWRPTPSPAVDLCYSMKYPIDVQLFPSVIFHFAGIGQQGEVDWVMDKNYLFKVRNDGFCMAIYGVADPGPSLLGAYQQINFKVLFDVNNGLLSFVPQVCHEASF